MRVLILVVAVPCLVSLGCRSRPSEDGEPSVGIVSTPKSKASKAVRVHESLAPIKRTIRQRFPNVRQLSTEKLSALMTSSEVILLDVRRPEEYAISHLKHAFLAQDEGQALDALAGVDKDAMIVTYCSVGYRSSALAEQLAARGYSNVHNLEGSIFAWGNEGRPVYREGKQVDKIHPYDRRWGKMLDERLRAELR